MVHHLTFRANYLRLNRLGNFYYKIGEGDDGPFIVFLDSTDHIESYTAVLRITIFTVVISMVVVFCIAILVSMRAIRPEIENIQRQREFITNAGHELKTPLAVIRANTELNEMLFGSNEWSQSTLHQIDRMSELIKVFVTLAKADEAMDEGIFSELDLSSLAHDSFDAFRAVAEQENKNISQDITPGVAVSGDKSTLSALISVLVDNAVKYCDEGGSINISTAQKGKNAQLLVSNSYAAGKGMDYSRFFDRFYRADSSHNIDKGGYGIGLSIAQSVAEQHKGKLDVSWKDGVITFEFLMPLERGEGPSFSFRKAGNT